MSALQDTDIWILMRAIPTPDHHPYRGLGFECYLKATLKNELQLWDKKVEIHTLTNYLASGNAFTYLFILYQILQEVSSSKFISG